MSRKSRYFALLIVRRGHERCLCVPDVITAMLMMYDVNSVREDFPILARQIYGKPLVYLDNGATTQKPRCVVEAMVDEYYNVNANVHRGVHFLSQQA